MSNWNVSKSSSVNDERSFMSSDARQWNRNRWNNFMYNFFHAIYPNWINFHTSFIHMKTLLVKSYQSKSSALFCSPQNLCTYITTTPVHLISRIFGFDRKNVMKRPIMSNFEQEVSRYFSHQGAFSAVKQPSDLPALSQLFFEKQFKGKCDKKDCLSTVHWVRRFGNFVCQIISTISGRVFFRFTVQHFFYRYSKNVWLIFETSKRLNQI